MSVISLNELKLPKNVEMIQKKTSVSFRRNSKKAVLKGSALEITNPIKELGSRVKRYSEDVIQKCHLGSIRGVVPGIKDSVDLQRVLNKYFK